MVLGAFGAVMDFVGACSKAFGYIWACLRSRFRADSAGEYSQRAGDVSLARTIKLVGISAFLIVNSLHSRTWRGCHRTLHGLPPREATSN